MRKVANPGQILVSDVVRRLLPHPEGLGYKSLGVHQLEEYYEEEELFQLLHHELPAEFPPLDTLTAKRHNLPDFLTTFIGRDDDLMKVKQSVYDHRLTTLTGPGGAGKTRLSTQVAFACADRFSGGVWFVDLTWTNSGEAVVPRICAALNVKSVTDEDKLIDFFGHQRVLLVLDNCEQVAKDCRAILRRLLTACPNLHVLATSRKVLQVPGEQTHLLRGMSLPDNDHSADAASFDAVKLFLSRTADRRFGLNKTSLAPIVALCRKLDGLPLAIEIAASGTELLTVTQISERIDEFLERELADDQYKPYSPTIAATIRWSYTLLSPHARELLARLTVFPATWTLQSAQDVCAFGVVDPEFTDVLVLELVSHCLVFPERIQLDRKRFGMLQTTRQVLLRDEAGTPQELLERFVRKMSEVSELVMKRESEGLEAVAFELVESEYESLTKALELTLEGQPHLCVQISENLRDFWMRSGRIRDGRHWFKRLTTVSEIENSDRVKALSGLSSFYIRLDELEDAQEVLTIAEEALRAQGGYEWARIVGNQGNLWHRTNELSKAKDAFTTCLKVFHKLGYHPQEALTLINLGVIKMRLHEPLSECVDVFWQAVRCAEEFGSASMQANAYSSLAEAHGLLKEPYVALGFCKKSLELYQKGVWLMQTAWTLVNASNLLEEVGCFEASGLVWHASHRMEVLADTHFSPRQREILSRLQASLQAHLQPNEWISSQDLVSTSSAEEVIALSLGAIQTSLIGH
jgi:predicted ATPase